MSISFPHQHTASHVLALDQVRRLMRPGGFTAVLSQRKVFRSVAWDYFTSAPLGSGNMSVGSRYWVPSPRPVFAVSSSATYSLADECSTNGYAILISISIYSTTQLESVDTYHHRSIYHQTASHRLTAPAPCTSPPAPGTRHPPAPGPPYPAPWPRSAPSSSSHGTHPRIPSSARSPPPTVARSRGTPRR